MNTLETNQLFHNRYRLIVQKGSGSFGEVWLARDEELDLEVAIKIYVALDQRGVEEFKSEYKAAYALNHTNLLHPYHFDVFGQQPYLVMPYCPSSAVSLIGQSDEKIIWQFIRDVCAGLTYLHEKDILHRDIKPDNLLRGEDGVFLITDFGISTRMRNTLRRNSTRMINSTKDVEGSLPYMAPELFSDNPEAVKATDIWAFGVTLYEIITGDLPFFGQGGSMLLHGASLPKITANFSDDLKALIVACLSKNTWERPTALQLRDYAIAKMEGRNVSMSWETGNCKPVIQQEDSTEEQNPNRIAFKRNPKPWLWAIAVISVLLTIFFSVLSCALSYRQFEIFAVTEALVFIGSCLLLGKSKLGFWLIAVVQIVGTICFSCALKNMTVMDVLILLYLILTTIAGVIFLFWILRNSDVPSYTWRLMTKRMPVYVIIISIPLLSLVVIYTFNGEIQAHSDLEQYNELVSDCKKILYNNSVTEDNMVQARELLVSIKSIENKYSDINKKYDEYFDLQIRYKAILSKMEDNRKREEEAAQAKIGIKIDEILFGNSGQDDYASDYYSSLVASDIKYLHPRLQYDGIWKDTRIVKIFVKIIDPDGAVEHGYSSPEGYTYSTDAIFYNGPNKYAFLSGWGTDKGGLYSPGKYQIELWHEGERIYEQKFTLN